MSLPHLCEIPVILFLVSTPAPECRYDLYSKLSCGLEAIKAASQTSLSFIMSQTHLRAWLPHPEPRGRAGAPRICKELEHGRATERSCLRTCLMVCFPSNYTWQS